MIRSWMAGPALLACVLLPPSAGAAQVSTTAVLRGEVRDSLGGPVAAAEVLLRDTAQEVLAGTETDDEGRFLLLGLPPGGPYTLTIRHLGFADTDRTNLHLEAGQTRRLDITVRSTPLELGSINVTTAADLVFSGTRTGAATVIEERAIESLPSIERDFVGFAALSPMVSIEQKQISIAGQNTQFNNLKVDGALAQDVFGLSPSGVPGGQAGAKALPIDAVRQYSVLVAPYDVRQSGFTGGLLNATTRTGGDRWTATGFGYYRDDFFGGTREAAAVRGSNDPGEVSDFRSEIFGVTAGGPLPLDSKLFVAAEIERRRRPVPGFNVGSADPLRTQVVPDSLARLQQIASEAFGMEAGDFDAYTLENPLGNAFARLDIPLSDAHGLTLHYNWISAEEDLGATRFGFDAYEMSSNGLRLESQTHAAMARLSSRLGEHTTNELLLNVQRTADATRSPAASLGMPEVEVFVTSSVDSATYGRRVQFGADVLAQANELDQTVIQLTDNLGFAVGDHYFTTGVDAAVFSVRRLFLPAVNGTWRFRSLAELEANEAYSYERLVLDETADPDVRLSMLQVAGFFQDEWSVSRDLTLTMGVRLDLPVTLSRPGYNRTAEFETGVVTDRLPSGNPLFSPRIGLNWSPETTWRTQIRGGLGIFSGRPPLAWIADAYANTGLRTSLLQCQGVFPPDPLDPRFPAPGLTTGPLPEGCAAGNTSAPVPERNITFFDEDFRYPQDVRASLAVDQELPGGFVASVEALYTRALYQVALEDINLALPVVDPLPENGYTDGYGNRQYFGIPLTTGNRFGIMAPVRRYEGYGQILRVGNRSRNAALAVATEVQRRFSDRLDLRAAYTYTRAVDVRSLLYADAALNYGSTPIRFDPARPETRASAFDRPHRVLGSVWTRLLEWGDGLDMTIMYVGQAGTPYSYVYETDMNGDGYPGPGAVAGAYNDLLYVPWGFSDTPLSLASKGLMAQLIRQEECLSEAMGTIVGRNTCRTPWSHRLDFRLAQGIRTPFARVRIVGDIMNVLNLINPEWGLVRIAPDNVPVLNTNYRAGCPGFGCSLASPITGFYVGPRRRNPETGGIRAELPYIVSLPESQWRAQIGLRVEF